MRNDTRFCLLTNDVETTSIWQNTLRDETALKVLNEGMPILLDLYRQFDIKCTFYFTGYIAKLLPQVVRMVVPDGHEVASHGKSHLPENGFDIMPMEKQKRHLEYTKKLLEDISGREVISFRSPALRVNGDTARALLETGYRIDSSIAPQRFDFFLSFGGSRKLKWFTAPRLPYRVDFNNMFKRGDSELVEVPLTALFFPYVGTTMRIFPWLTSLQRRVVHAETFVDGKPVVFDIHPNEFIDESAETRLDNRRTSNIVTHLLKDRLRTRLKIRNLGKAAVPLYRREIEFYVKRAYRFATVRQYCQENGLI